MLWAECLPGQVQQLCTFNQSDWRVFNLVLQDLDRNVPVWTIIPIGSRHQWRGKIKRFYWRKEMWKNVFKVMLKSTMIHRNIHLNSTCKVTECLKTISRNIWTKFRLGLVKVPVVNFKGYLGEIPKHGALTAEDMTLLRNQRWLEAGMIVVPGEDSWPYEGNALEIFKKWGLIININWISQKNHGVGWSSAVWNAPHGKIIPVVD